MNLTEPVAPTINIRPEVNMLSVLKHLNYKAWFAVAEFVDNSIQSHLANLDALRALALTYEQRCVQEREASTVAGMLRYWVAMR